MHASGVIAFCMTVVNAPPRLPERVGISLGADRDPGLELSSTLPSMLRMRVERTFAWEDKFKRLLLRFERIQQRHYGMKLMAYTLINLREFCGI